MVSPDWRRARALVLAMTIVVLLTQPRIAVGVVYYDMLTGSGAAVTPPEVVLQSGTAGASTIYTNGTGAEVTVSASGSGLNFFHGPTYYYDVTPTTAGSWVDIDVSSFIPAGSTGVILEIVNTGDSNYRASVRKNGATYDITQNRVRQHGHIYALCAVDEDRIFEAYVEDLSVKLYLVGYTDSAVFFFDDPTAHDYSLNVNGSWQDIDLSGDVPANATGVIIWEVNTGAAGEIGAVRCRGSTDDYSSNGQFINRGHRYSLIAVDSNRFIEGYISDVVVDFYLVGYVTKPVTLFVNGKDVSLTTAGSWETIDATGETSPIADGLIVQVINRASGFRQSQVREYGGSQDWHTETDLRRESYCFYYVGCDEEQRFQGWIEDTNQDFYILGFCEPRTHEFVDYVDSISNVDSSPDIGIHSNFTAQQSGPDSIYDLLTEENTADKYNVTLIDAESFEGTWPPTGWSATGRWGQDSSQAYDGAYSAYFPGLGNGRSGDLDTPDLDCSDAVAIYVEFWYRDDDLDADDLLLQYFNGTSWVTVSDLGATTQEDQWLHYREKITDSGYFVSNFKVRWSAVTVRTGEHAWIDYVTVKKEVQPYNYQLDLEVQWTNVDFDEGNEELCIYCGTMGSEDLGVDVWYNSTWQVLFTDLSPGWNNISVTPYLDSSTFTIRFKGGTETGDTTQDSWEIDVALLHLWTNVTYDYVLQVVNQVADDRMIQLQVYNSSNIDRISTLTISLHDSTTSDQIVITDGSITQSEGSMYNLSGSTTIYISIDGLRTNGNGVSWLYVYLIILVPGTSTYTRYPLVFEVV